MPWVLLIALAFGALLGGWFGDSKGPQVVLTKASPGTKPVPSLIGMSLSKAERTITAWGFYTYSIAQWPRIGHGGTVIYQSPRAGTRLVPQDTAFSLAVGVSYHFTALLKVDGCLAVDVDLEQISPRPVEVVPDAPYRTLPVNLEPKDVDAWRIFGLPSLIAPHDWTCTGFVSEDGGNSFTAVPPGEVPPSPQEGASEETPVPEIAVYGVPACQGCVYGIAGAYFPASGDNGTYTTPTKIPAGEIYRRVGTHVVDFTDPPGVKGTGEPSGGSDPSVGAIVFKPHSAAVITCILPPAEVEICTTAIRAFTTYELATNPVGEAEVRIAKTHMNSKTRSR